jgi:maleate isomerase
MTKRTLIGMLTPSSNTTLEPLCGRMVAGLEDVSVHFARFPVTQIALSPDALAQFDLEPMLDAAELLADAQVDAIGWNGTSAGWLGFDADTQLVARIRAATGIPATTSTMAMIDAFAALDAHRIAFVTPYQDDVQGKILEHFGAGHEIVAERHLGLRDNFSFSEVTPETLSGLIREVARSAPDAIAVFCTNLRAAQLADDLERELGIPIVDTVATGMWAALRLARIDPARVRGWGRLFAAPLPEDMCTTS